MVDCSSRDEFEEDARQEALVTPQLAPQIVDVPRSTFNFDFKYEKKILAEADKENPNWNKFVVERHPPKQRPPPRGPRHAAPTTSMVINIEWKHVHPKFIGSNDLAAEYSTRLYQGSSCGEYISMGVGCEAVSFAVLNYGDNPTKVKEFVKSYNALHEDGLHFPELVAIHDNDPDKVIQHLLGAA